MLEDIVLAALGGARAAGSLIERELERLKDRGDLKPEELEALVREVRERLEARVEKAKAVAEPLVGMAGEAVRRVLDVAGRGELRELAARLDRLAAALAETRGAAPPEPRP